MQVSEARQDLARENAAVQLAAYLDSSAVLDAIIMPGASVLG